MIASATLGWIYVGLATLAELVGVYGLSLYSMRRTIPNFLLYYGGLALSFGLIYMALRHIDLSIAYTVYMGAGTAGAVIINMLFFGEARNIFRIMSLIAIIIGVMGLKYVSP